MDKKTPNKPCRESVEWGYIGRVNIYQSVPDQRRGNPVFEPHLTKIVYNIPFFYRKTEYALESILMIQRT